MATTIPPASAAIAAAYAVEGTALVGRDRRLSPVEIGDTKQPDFKPQIKIPRWNNAANVSIRLATTEPAAVTFEREAVVYRGATFEARFYGIDDIERADGHEFEVRLLERPASNVLTFTVQHKGGEWTRQEPLEHENPDGSTWGLNPWGGERRRPAHVNGSYVYYVDQAGDYSAIGGHNYRTGKVCHIYRPWAEDAAGVRVWCDLRLSDDTSILTIAIPSAFLDAAAYPVVVDPTFGYSGVAASDDNIGGAHILCKALTTPASNGSLTSITIKGRIKGNVGRDPDHAPAIYSDSAGVPNAKLAAVDTVGSTYAGADGEVTTNIAFASLVSGTQYWIGSRQASGHANVFNGTCDAWFKFDASGGANFSFKVQSGEVAWEATAATFNNTATNEKVYIFGTFTASGGTTPTVETWGSNAVAPRRRSRYFVALPIAESAFGVPVDVPVLVWETPQPPPARRRRRPTSVAGLVAPVVVSGGASTLNVGGNITPAGALVRSTSKATAGTVTPAAAAALLKAAAKVFGGTVTPTGAATRQTSKAVAGALTPGGALSRAASKAVAGAIVSAGSLRKAVAKVLAGAVGLAGAVTTTIVTLRTWTGTVTPAGTLTRQAQKATGGTITSGGTLKRDVAAARAGGVAPAGALRKDAAKRAAGNMAPAGSLATEAGTGLHLSGTLAPAGLLVRLTSKGVAGTLAPSSTVSRASARRFAGTVTPTGLVLRGLTYFLAKAGGVAPSGQVTITLGGVLGAVIHAIARRVGGRRSADRVDGN